MFHIGQHRFMPKKTNRLNISVVIACSIYKVNVTIERWELIRMVEILQVTFSQNMIVFDSVFKDICF